MHVVQEKQVMAPVLNQWFAGWSLRYLQAEPPEPPEWVLLERMVGPAPPGCEGGAPSSITGFRLAKLRMNWVT